MYIQFTKCTGIYDVVYTSTKLEANIKGAYDSTLRV